MRKIDIRNELACDAATFWQAFWDARYDALLRDAARYTRQLLDDRTEGSLRLWKARVIPDRKLPSMVRGVLGADKLIYVQHNKLDTEVGVLEWRVVPEVMSDKVRCEGTMTVRDLAGGRSERLVRGEIEVKVFGIGGRVERTIAENIETSYAAATDVLAEWLRT